MRHFSFSAAASLEHHQQEDVMFWWWKNDLLHCRDICADWELHRYLRRSWSQQCNFWYHVGFRPLSRPAGKMISHSWRLKDLQNHHRGKKCKENEWINECLMWGFDKQTVIMALMQLVYPFIRTLMFLFFPPFSPQFSLASSLLLPNSLLMQQLPSGEGRG